MKLTFTKSDLLQGVNISLRAVPSRTTLPILECILIDASTNEIKFTSNNMELGIETKVNGEILERGKIAIDAKIFSDIVRKLPDNEITLSTDSNFNTVITCEKAKFNIACKSGEDFSYLPAIEKDKSVTLSQFVLKEMIRQTIFSISDNESKKIMTGELFEINDNKLKVVSLDGHRISVRNTEVDSNGNTIKAIIPGKSLIEISKILSSEIDDSIHMFFTSNHVLFEFDNTTVVSRLIEGEYFRIENMISNDYDTKVIVNKKEFLDCIDRATLLVREGDKKPIIINITDGNMELKVNSPLGSMNEDVDISKEGKDIMIGFNPKFLIDALRVIDEEEISIYMVNSKAPCVIRDAQEKYVYLILPVNFTQV
jgi:DNA polymerase-3 subunit beta